MQTIRGKRVQLLNDTHPENLTDLLLFLRGLERGFFDQEVIHDPLLLPAIEKAVDRIFLAQKNKERVMIFGDYDVDGISSTAALFLFLRDEMGMDVSYRLPHRVHDGYGIKSYHMEEIAQTGSKLVITVDCGTKDIEPIQRAYELGLEVIVTDHHSCPEILPECVAVVNPRRKDSLYPFHGLSGSGVVWKVIHALLLRIFQENRKQKTENTEESFGNISHILQKYVDIVSLGTVADCMPMIDENRTIVRRGLLQAQKSHHPFFQTFAQSLNRPIVNEEDIGFFVGPLLNAGGRIATPYQSLSALLASSLDAFAKIQGLMGVNETRKGMSRDAYERALQSVDTSAPFLLFFDEMLEHGILGLVAAKLSEAFHRPCGVFTRDKDMIVGSLRAPVGIDLVKILDTSSPMLQRYGGHAGAAGCSIAFSDMQAAFDLITKSTQELYRMEDFVPMVTVDTALDLDRIDLSLAQQIENLRPFGASFPSPLFMLKNVHAPIAPLGQTGEHIRWDIAGQEIIAFRMGEHTSSLAESPHHLIGTIKTRIWRDKVSVQFQVVDAVRAEN